MSDIADATGNHPGHRRERVGNEPDWFRERLEPLSGTCREAPGKRKSLWWPSRLSGGLMTIVVFSCVGRVHPPDRCTGHSHAGDSSEHTPCTLPSGETTHSHRQDRELRVANRVPGPDVRPPMEDVRFHRPLPLFPVRRLDVVCPPTREGSSPLRLKNQ